jgi:cell division protein FtsB
MRPVPRRAVTGRALVLGTVFVLLVVLLASPISRYFGSRSDVRSAAAQLQQDRQRLAELKKQQARWADPGYIQRQAREILQYAMPGDIVYTVVDRGSKNQIDATTSDANSTAPVPSWNAKLWSSVQRADKAP